MRLPLTDSRLRWTVFAIAAWWIIVGVFFTPWASEFDELINSSLFNEGRGERMLFADFLLRLLFGSAVVATIGAIVPTFPADRERLRALLKDDGAMVAVVAWCLLVAVFLTPWKFSSFGGNGSLLVSPHGGGSVQIGHFFLRLIFGSTIIAGLWIFRPRIGGSPNR